jgi:hypothetical protein
MHIGMIEGTRLWEKASPTFVPSSLNTIKLLFLLCVKILSITPVVMAVFIRTADLETQTFQRWKSLAYWDVAWPIEFGVRNVALFLVPMLQINLRPALSGKWYGWTYWYNNTHEAQFLESSSCSYLFLSAYTFVSALRCPASACRTLSTQVIIRVALCTLQCLFEPSFVILSTLFFVLDDVFFHLPPAVAPICISLLNLAYGWARPPIAVFLFHNVSANHKTRIYQVQAEPHLPLLLSQPRGERLCLFGFVDGRLGDKCPDLAKVLVDWALGESVESPERPDQGLGDPPIVEKAPHLQKLQLIVVPVLRSKYPPPSTLAHRI